MTTHTDTRTWYRPGYTCMWNQICRLTPITPKQLEVLEYVVDHIDRHGYAPSVREIGQHFGFLSTRTAGQHLHNLARKGAIQITPGIARGIRIIKRPAEVHELSQEHE